MNRCLFLVLCGLWSCIMAVADAPVYPLRYRDTAGTVRQYQGSYRSDLRVTEACGVAAVIPRMHLVARDAWKAEERVTTGENELSTLTFQLLDGTETFYLPALKWIYQLSRTPMGEPVAMSPFTVSYTRAANGAIHEATCATGSVPDHSGRDLLAGAAPNDLFTAGMVFPVAECSIGDTWLSTQAVKVGEVVDQQQTVPFLVDLRKTYRVGGVKIVDGKTCLIIAADFSGDRQPVCCSTYDGKGRLVKGVVAARVRGSATYLFDVDAGEMARLDVAVKSTINITANGRRMRVTNDVRADLQRVSDRRN